jgi:hypothetical protein
LVKKLFVLVVGRKVIEYNEKDLSEEQEIKLIQVKEVSPELKIMHELLD